MELRSIQTVVQKFDDCFENNIFMVYPGYNNSFGKVEKPDNYAMMMFQKFERAEGYKRFRGETDITRFLYFTFFRHLQT
jgi:hypothetical protein